jgi:hypothetical protein
VSVTVRAVADPDSDPDGEPVAYPHLARVVQPYEVLTLYGVLLGCCSRAT